MNSMLLREITCRAEQLTQEGKLQWVRNGTTYDTSLGKDNPRMSISRADDDMITFGVLGPLGDLRGTTCDNQNDLKRLYGVITEQVALREGIKKLEKDRSYLRFTLGVLKKLV